ncbi:MAG TPA: hypothetical protein VFH42_04125 [Sporolactobacillaceae bacterium]|nr:hypothetical protein [Sporolactobacillaceae bacterium]
MALQCDYTFNGITVASAYHKIGRMDIQINANVASVFVFVYKDQATRQANDDDYFAQKTILVTTDQFGNFLTPTDINPLDKNHVSQSYDYLKTLPDYTGAVDV